ncbi:MAG: carbohydrate ABC transporter permease, partial [Chloroflexota bacterium]
FKAQVDIMSSEPTWVFAPTTDNYEVVIFGQKFDRYLTNSVIVGLTTTFLTLFTAGLASYALARLQFPGRGLLAHSTLLIRMVPTAVLAVPVFALWQNWGIEDGRLGLILFYTALGLPFAIWLLFGFIKQIPIELEEAAIIDGCNAVQIFFQILFPLMRAGYAVAAIFTFRIAWNEFLLALILTNRYTRTLPVATTLYLTDEGVQWGRIMAMGTLLVIPPLLLTFASARQVIQGMTAGAVKG